MFNVEVSKTSNASGRNIGKTVVLKDITEERLKRQRIEVLNKIVRHNIRNNVQVAMGNIESLRDEVRNTEKIDKTIRNLEDLTRFGKKEQD